MRYCLGIDAGGTKTTAVLADANTVLAKAQSGSIKITRNGSGTASSNLAALFADLKRQSGVAAESIVSACVGLSGITVPQIADWTRFELQKHLSGQVLLCGDEEIALDGAFHGGPGVLVIAGTGSNVVGRSPQGEIFHLGGWGPVLSDEGSGYWIGLQAVRATLQAMDRGETTES
jgi:glucosamine kinase